MGQRFLRRLSCVVVLLSAMAASLPARAQELASGFAAQVAFVLPSVVMIHTAASTPQGRMYFDGSGFIIDPSGIIVTNRHVIAGAYKITVTVPNLGQLSAKPLYISSVLDLALLKVEAGQPLPRLKLGDSDTVRVGDEVLLLGNPLGVGLSVTHGVISALNRDIGESLYDHFFQTDAALNHGSSGGPMINMSGEVIGINTALYSSPGNTGSVGVGFTMPINDAKFVIDQFLRTGRVVAGTIGVQAQRITDDLASAFGLTRTRGLIVTEVDPNGPAAGHIQVGDILLQVNGREESDARALARLVATTPAGQSLAVRLLRRGAEQDVTVPVRGDVTSPNAAMRILGHAPPNEKAFATPSDPGMSVATITPDVRRRLGLRNDVKGVVVTAVAPNSVAAEQKITVGDLVLAVGDEPVNEPPDLKRQLQAVVASGRQFAALLIRGQRGSRWVALPVEADR